MAKIHIVLDSTANVPQAMLNKYDNLHVVPLTVRLGDQEWPELQLSAEALFALIANTNNFPKTSQPAPGDFLQVFTPLAAEQCAIIVITISGGLSGTVHGAKAAALLAAAKQIYVLDSGTTAIGMVRLAETALNLVEQGLTVEQIVNNLKARIERTQTMFAPGTLEYLHKGGRIGRAAALFGGILQIRPVLHLVEGKVDVLDKVRTQQRALARMVEELASHQHLEYIGIVHIAASEKAELLAKQLRDRYPDTQLSVSTAGSVLGAHLGPGLVGIIYQDKLSKKGGR